MTIYNFWLYADELDKLPSSHLVVKMWVQLSNSIFNYIRETVLAGNAEAQRDLDTQRDILGRCIHLFDSMIAADDCQAYEVDIVDMGLRQRSFPDSPTLNRIITLNTLHLVSTKVLLDLLTKLVREGLGNVGTQVNDLSEDDFLFCLNAMEVVPYYTTLVVETHLARSGIILPRRPRVHSLHIWMKMKVVDGSGEIISLPRGVNPMSIND